MVGCDGVGNILHQDGLTSLGLCDDECTLTFTDRGEEVDDTHAGIGRGLVAAEGELLFGEEWRQMLEGHAVAHLRGLTAIDHLDGGEGEILLVLMRRAHAAVHHVASLQAILLDLLGRHIDIVGR